jgi:hypothetical protein
MSTFIETKEIKCYIDKSGTILKLRPLICIYSYAICLFSNNLWKEMISRKKKASSNIN